MKLSEYIIIFFIIFCSFSLITFYSINTESKASIAGTEYANILTAACHDAAKTVSTEKVESDGVWLKEKEREETLKTFYTTLQLGFNFEYTSKSKETTIYTPVVCLIDNNGYYISFNSAFDESGNTIRPFQSSNDDAKIYDTTMSVSPLNTWVKQYEEYTIRYYLNDTLEVTLPEGQIVKEKRKEIPAILQEYARKGIISNSYMIPIIEDMNGVRNKYSIYDILINKDDVYEREKIDLIISEINEEVEFYINYHNLWAVELDIPYSYTMPEIVSEDWHRLLTNPTVISFLQGIQAKTQKQFLNIYALSGGEYTTERQYYFTEEVVDGKTIIVYHLLNGKCKDHNTEYVKLENSKESHDSNDTNEVIYEESYYTCDGVKIKRLYTAMEACSKQGAYPCTCAINYNYNE